MSDYLKETEYNTFQSIKTTEKAEAIFNYLVLGYNQVETGNIIFAGGARGESDMSAGMAISTIMRAYGFSGKNQGRYKDMMDYEDCLNFVRNYTYPDDCVAILDEYARQCALKKQQQRQKEIEQKRAMERQRELEQRQEQERRKLLERVNRMSDEAKNHREEQIELIFNFEDWFNEAFQMGRFELCEEYLKKYRPIVYNKNKMNWPDNIKNNIMSFSLYEYYFAQCQFAKLALQLCGVWEEEKDMSATARMLRQVYEQYEIDSLGDEMVEMFAKIHPSFRNMQRLNNIEPQYKDDREYWMSKMKTALCEIVRKEVMSSISKESANQHEIVQYCYEVLDALLRDFVQKAQGVLTEEYGLGYTKHIFGE